MPKVTELQKEPKKGDILRMANAATPAGSASSRPASVKEVEEKGRGEKEEHDDPTGAQEGSRALMVI